MFWTILIIWLIFINFFRQKNKTGKKRMDIIRRWHFTVENQAIVSLFALCNMFVFRNAPTVLLDTDNYTNGRST